MLKRALWLTTLLLFIGVCAVRAEEINPPFGLRWGETSQRLERLLVGAKATIVDRHLVDGKEAWEVEGLVQTGLKRTVFYFHRGELIEVELQYQQEGWDDTRYTTLLNDVRKRLEQNTAKASSSRGALNRPRMPPTSRRKSSGTSGTRTTRRSNWFTSPPTIRRRVTARSACTTRRSSGSVFRQQAQCFASKLSVSPAGSGLPSARAIDSPPG